MRILRNNQKKFAKASRSAAAFKAVRTEIPPYRMSKLTEIFQEFFEGRGRVVRSQISIDLDLRESAS
jgi:kinesin family protein 20